MKKSNFEESCCARPLNNWYRRCFRRILVDMHIPDWDKRFLARLTARQYVDNVLRGKPTSTMLYCISHVGLALYPSRVGPVHAALRNRDFMGEVLHRCHQKGLAVVAYYSAVYNNAMFLKHPEWRIRPSGGTAVYQKSRYGVCCPNSPYRDFAVAQTEEICQRYPFDGIFFDMLFWPYVCYCKYCRARFQKEEGKNLPEIIDWHNPVWMAFQRARERWMSELAGTLTAAVRRTRSSMTVTHQMSPVLHDWRLAMPFSLTQHCDYTSGDFYGPAIQQSLACKIFEALSVRRPFEFHTSCCVDLRDHVTMKSPLRMETQAFLAPAHATAFMFIDAIDPEGTLNRGVYERIGQIFSRLKPYEKHLGGSLSADVAIYVSSDSRFSFRENGIHVNAYSQQSDNMASLFSASHMDAVMGAARALQETHIPFAVLTRNNLDHLDKYRVVLLPNVLVMTDEEISAFRQFVARGGGLYASAYSSLVDVDGRIRKDFGLADVLGISRSGPISRGGPMDHGLAFFTPADRKLAELVSPQQHVIHKGGRLAIRTVSAEVLATVTSPYYPEAAGTVLKPSFSSIHSNPPGPTGHAPALVWHRYGRGRACYAIGALEAEPQEINRTIMTHLIQKLLKDPVRVQAEAPRFVEITVFDKPAEQRLNISLVSLREQDGGIPCDGSVCVRLDPGRRLVALRTLPGRRRYPCRKKTGNAIEFDFHKLRLFMMFELEYSLKTTPRK